VFARKRIFMKVYSLERKVVLPITMEQAWEFFSNPKNLKEITPDYMYFKVTNEDELEKMYPGQIITYIVKPVLGIPMSWCTEIKNVEKHKMFVDEQRFGPYALWHHKHKFREVDGGVENLDLVHYAIPFGIFGRIAHWLFVKKKLTEIFDFRNKKLAELFGTVKLEAA